MTISTTRSTIVPGLILLVPDTAEGKALPGISLLKMSTLVEIVLSDVLWMCLWCFFTCCLLFWESVGDAVDKTVLSLGDTALSVTIKVSNRFSSSLSTLICTVCFFNSWGHFACLCNVMPYFLGWWPRSQFCPASDTIFLSWSMVTPTKHSLPGMSTLSV